MYSCTMPVPDPRAGGGGGAGGHMTPPPPRRGRGCPKKIAHYMILRVYGNGLCGLVEVWGGLGYFGVVWGFSMDRTTVMLTVK